MTLLRPMRHAAQITLLIAPMTILSLTPGYAEDAKPMLSPLFTDNMVLQRNVADPIWGWTTPGQTVTVSLNGKTARAVAGPDGKWMTKIGPFAAGGPYTLTVTGAQSTTLTNILIGDVWVCSGQSNMEFGVGNAINGAEEIAKANYPQIRIFTVTKKTSLSPLDTTAGQWQECTPDSIKSQGTWNGFSAVGYFFGRELNQKLHIPIGLIQSSWGGTVAQAWTSGSALKKMPDFAPQVKQIEASQNTTDPYTEQLAKWYAKNDAGTSGKWQETALSDTDWKTMPLPVTFQDAGIAELSTLNGVVWFRRTFDLPASDAGKAAVLHLIVDDNDTTWVNGVPVGTTEGWNTVRSYAIPTTLLKPTGNVIAVRVTDTGGKGGIYGDPAKLSLEVPGGQNVDLTGPWRYRIGEVLTADNPVPVSTSNNPNVPTALYNAMISPMLPFAIKGATWYQGESNAGAAAQYRTLLPTMIEDWQSRFEVGKFPFLIVQLAGWQPGGDSWADLRQAQWLTAKTVPNAGIVAAIDIGDSADIHPKNKQEVGHRLALVAEAKVYGEKIEYSGPVYKSMHVEGHSIRLTFDHVGGGLVAKDGKPLTSFLIAGVDGKFVPADAHIDGSSVVVSSPDISAPSGVRYAWSSDPESSLYNKDGLPAFPFDTSGK